MLLAVITAVLVNCVCHFHSMAKKWTSLTKLLSEKSHSIKATTLFESGAPLQAIYAVRSGSFKSYTLSERGDEQITGFHLAGDLVGFDAISKMTHPSFSQALETSMVCEIPFDTLDELSGKTT